MPKYKNWGKLDTTNPAWKYHEEILVEGVITEVVVHAWKWGETTEENGEDWFAELYFSEAGAEEQSIHIRKDGSTSEHAGPYDSMTEAEEACREFLRKEPGEYDIRAAAGASSGLGGWDKVDDFYYEHPEAEKILEVQKDGERTYRMFLYEGSHNGKELLGSVGAGATEEDAKDRIREAALENPEDITMEDLI